MNNELNRTGVGKKPFRWLFLFGLFAVGLGIFLLAIPQADVRSQADPTTPRVLEVAIDGTIGRGTVRQFTGDLDDAVMEGYALVVIRLDTPGGDLDATRDLVNAILASPLPIAVYVAPDGARAASAGTFIGAAADFLVMSPVSNIGAASPVDSSGADLPTTLDAKVREDAAALIRSIGEARGRNIEALEETVFNAISYSASEAVQLQIADFIATNTAQLLQNLNGMQFERDGVSATLNLTNAQIVTQEGGFLDGFVSFLSSPSIAYFLIVIGIAGIIFEIANFGLILPGVLGVTFLALGAVGAWQLPLSWVGALLLALAVVLFIGEIFVAGFGVLGILGGVSLVLGGIFLFDDSRFIGAAVDVSPWVIGVTAGVVTVLLVWSIYEIRRSQSKGRGYLQRSRTGNLSGKIGVVTSALDPAGEVFLNGEYWVANSHDEATIPIGVKVKVKHIDGLHLAVEREDDDQSAMANGK